jgi:hypothetical protein
MTTHTHTLPVVRAAELEVRDPAQQWLVRSLWSRAAVGIVGGAPKSCKSFLGLDLATSVASGTPCLDRFIVDAPGPALIYLAEDALPCVRARVDALCQHRRLDIRGLDLHVVTAPSLRLDLDDDQLRLRATLDRLRPRLLLLDPLVRLHRGDENSARDIAALLGFLRDLQRTFDVAIVLVHHASKRYRTLPGQGLRGSGDLHAFGDSNIYLARHDDVLKLSVEHRAAIAPDPLVLKLVSAKDGSSTHLQVQDGRRNEAGQRIDRALPDVVLGHLQEAGAPQTRTAIRRHLRLNNQRLGEALEYLERQGLATRGGLGWSATAPEADQQRLPLLSPC